MKIITLAGPTTVDTGNPPRGFAELRHPVEGPLLVSDAEAVRLSAADMLTVDPEELPETEIVGEPQEAGAADDLTDLKVPELTAKALKDGVPLNDATTKPAIIAAFVAHRAAQA